MAENRDEANYYGQTAVVQNATGGTDDIFETLTYFALNNDRFNIVFKGWTSVLGFQTYAESNPRYLRGFNPLIADLTTQEQTAIRSLKQSILTILGVSANEYDFMNAQIDAEALTGIISAQHKTKRQFLHRFITTPEEFITLKAEQLQLFTDFTLFSWGYGKSQDSFLNSLS